MSLNKSSARYTVATITLLLIAGLALYFTWDRLRWGTNYSKEPAATVFQRVTGKTLPPGVTGLRVSGRQLAIKHWVWITFSASDKAIQFLTKDKEPMDSETAKLWLSRNFSADTKFDIADKKAVGWKVLSNLTPKDVYEIGHFDETMSIMWAGYMAIDKQTNTLYIHAGD